MSFLKHYHGWTYFSMYISIYPFEMLYILLNWKSTSYCQWELFRYSCIKMFKINLPIRNGTQFYKFPATKLLIQNLNDNKMQSRVALRMKQKNIFWLECSIQMVCFFLLFPFISSSHKDYFKIWDSLLKNENEFPPEIKRKREWMRKPIFWSCRITGDKILRPMLNIEGLVRKFSNCINFINLSKQHCKMSDWLLSVRLLARTKCLFLGHPPQKKKYLWHSRKHKLCNSMSYFTTNNFYWNTKNIWPKRTFSFTLFSFRIRTIEMEKNEWYNF